jgi:hypothetical protein
MWFILTIIVLVVIYHIKSVNVKNAYFLYKKRLSKSECEELIDMSKKYTLETKLDGVDNKPEYQIDIYDCKQVVSKDLYEKAIRIYNKHIRKRLTSVKHPDFIFLKRYKQGERIHIPIHYDDSRMSFNFLLSDTNDFTGGELYMFDKTQSKLIDKSITTSTRDTFINTYKNLPIIHDFEQGDLIEYEGGEQMHGILPVKSGVRYLLTFFFE